MRSKKWKWFNYIFAGSIFGSGLLFLLKPWFNFFYRLRPDTLAISQQFWLVLVVVVTAILAKKIGKLEKNIMRLVVVGFFIIINIFLIYYQGWLLRYFLISLFFMVVAGLRFEMYFGGASFNRDFGLVIVFLIATLFLNNRYNLELDFLQISLIFISGITLSLFFNFDLPDDRDKFKIITTIALLSGFIAFIIALLVPGTASFITDITGYIMIFYFKLVDLFMIIIYPIIWLINPIYKFLIYLINKFSGNPVEAPKSPGMDSGLEDMIKQAEKTKDISGGIGLWWLYILLGLLIVYLSFKVWNLSQNNNEEGFSETRESLLTSQALKDDFKQFMNKIKRPFGRENTVNIYDKSSSVMIIREIYYKFISRSIRYKPYHRSYTPNNYLALLLRIDQLNFKKDYLRVLTVLYNRARYGGRADREDVERAEEIWQELTGE